MNTKNQIIAELSAPIIQDLATQHTKKMLDCYLGKYDLEEGETVDEDFSLEEMSNIAKRIILCESVKEPIVVTYDEVYENDDSC